MNNDIKTSFSIKDLENLTGIKAHTIRIWEKRYNILKPTRTETNIRHYDSENLQKLLNITLLVDYGYKISKIANHDSKQLNELVKKITSERNKNDQIINSFKISMMHFDQHLFNSTYNELLSQKTFKEIFREILIPLIEEIGILWQTDTITPAHEHFISHLIRQKTLSNIESIQNNTMPANNKVYVLLLPINEIHELGLLYLNYELLSNGYKTIYLGQSVPTESLKHITDQFKDITFIVYTTIEPTKDKVSEYVEHFKKVNLTNKANNLWMIGRMTSELNPSSDFKTFRGLKEILEEIK
ncbi:MAG: HTH-type transcriptional repressor CarH [Bacteroidota bacterium]